MELYGCNAVLEFYCKVGFFDVEFTAEYSPRAHSGVVLAPGSVVGFAISDC